MLYQHFAMLSNAFVQGGSFMKRHVITAVLLSLAIVTPLFAQPSCAAPFARVSGKLTSPQEYTLSWEPVPGAVFYTIEERHSADPRGLKTTRIIDTSATSIDIKHESINDVTYEYSVKVIGGNCSMSAFVKTFGDPELRRAVRRGIVPVVGSARGANGSLFKTFLRLEGPNLKGRLFFHPAGRPASDDDPSLPYDLTHTQELVWDDVVAALGQSGIGSLSIVPNEGEAAELPRATVRLYNVAENGIFGATAEMYPAVAFLDQDAPFQRVAVPEDGNFRVNVGARAVLDGRATALFITKDGQQKGIRERAFRAGEMVMGSPEAVYGLALEPGEVLLVTFSRAMIPFYTLTDNRTNDPFLYVQGAEPGTSVDQYVK
jgi:hypothetical protein